MVRLQAAELIRDAHLTLFGGGQILPTQQDCSAEGIACAHAFHRDRDGKTVIETVFYDGAVSGTQCGSLGCGHYYGGEDDDPKAWVYSRGPSTTQIAWEFFARHTLSGNQPPRLQASSEVRDSSIRAPVPPATPMAPWPR